MTGNELLAKCGGQVPRNEEELRDRMACGYYIEAIGDAMQSNSGVHGVRACMPMGVDMSQKLLIVYEYIYFNIDKRHIIASALIAAALAKTFPCG